MVGGRYDRDKLRSFSRSGEEDIEKDREERKTKLKEFKKLKVELYNIPLSSGKGKERRDEIVREIENLPSLVYQPTKFEEARLRIYDKLHTLANVDIGGK